MEATSPQSYDYTEIIRRLPVKLRLAYGIGHVLNDICASMWFTYLLLFFHVVLEFDSFTSGLLLFIGQVADGIATPFIGLQSDSRDNFWLCKYGRRKTWHLIGTLCILGSFPFIFSPCINCEGSHRWAQLIYFGAFILIFQFGWAAVQISHLSLIPDLTPSEHERTELTAIRYSFTVCSNILVYLITWFVLHISSEPDLQIGPKDAYKFQHVVWIGLAIGAVTSLVFHIFVREGANPADARVAQHRQTSVGSVLRNLQLYLVGAVYMATRLFANLSQVYVPLYLHEALNMTAESLAIIPLVMFLSSFVTSVVVKLLNKKCGRKISFMIGSTIGLAACVWIRFGTGSDTFTTYEIYPVAGLLGAGSSIMLVTSLGITADLIGPNTETGAFVYGSMSFTDKLSNGIAVTVIQSFKCRSTCSFFYRDVLAYVCGGAALFGILMSTCLTKFRYDTVPTDQIVYTGFDESLDQTESPSHRDASAPSTPVIS